MALQPKCGPARSPRFLVWTKPWSTLPNVDHAWSTQGGVDQLLTTLPCVDQLWSTFPCVDQSGPSYLAWTEVVRATWRGVGPHLDLQCTYYSCSNPYIDSNSESPLAVRPTCLSPGVGRRTVMVGAPVGSQRQGTFPTRLVKQRPESCT